MAIDYSVFAIPKGRPRVVDRIQKKRDLAQQERDCRAAVKRRDKGRCVVPGCKEASVHLHHITYRSKGGKWRTGNIASLCVKHHQMVHAALIQISGDADEHLTITGSKDLLRFKL
jgi:5-methylcytosine-specific restriction endonuclease McrA